MSFEMTYRRGVLDIDVHDSEPEARHFTENNEFVIVRNRQGDADVSLFMSPQSAISLRDELCAMALGVSDDN